jgi:F-type H+-transporting ATPase subunit gamma
MEDPERAQTRLSNIQSVQPILGALRTISLGSWQAAQKQQRVARFYQSHLQAMLPAVLPHLPETRNRATSSSEFDGRNALLVIGSERGLCGRFNHLLAERTEQILKQQDSSDPAITIVALGSRLARTLRQRRISPDQFAKTPKTLTDLNRLAYQLTNNWLIHYEKGEIAQVSVLFNAYQGIGQYHPRVVMLIPPHLASAGDELKETLWPPPIIETDPVRLYTAIVVQLITVTLYSLMLESAAAEYSARYQLMEAATQNTERLIETLSIDIQAARRQTITQEMQILASGAGLLKS